MTKGTKQWSKEKKRKKINELMRVVEEAKTSTGYMQLRSEGSSILTLTRATTLMTIFSISIKEMECVVFWIWYLWFKIWNILMHNSK